MRARPRSAHAWGRLARAAAPLPARALVSTGDARRRPLVAVITPGGGLIRRGYEAFAAEFADQLAGRDDVAVRLLQGGPSDAADARRVARLDRHRTLAKALARVTPFYATSIEHYSFGVASLPRLVRERPAVMILSERVLANFYGVVLRRLGVGTRIVLRNGGSHRPPFRHVDLVIHHTPAYLEAALAASGETATHVHIPYAFELRPEFDPERLTPAWRERRRRELDLPVDRPIVLSVGALDKVVKQMDHVVREVAQLGDLRPFLLLLGQREDETPEVEALAADLLGEGSWRTATVSASEVVDYFDLADAFVLASPREGFGRVYVEAVTAGLPCVLHDTEHSRWVLGEHGRYADMFEPGAAAAQLREALSDPHELDPDRRRARRLAMYERYSWDRLLPRYLEALGVSGDD